MPRNLKQVIEDATTIQELQPLIERMYENFLFTAVRWTGNNETDVEKMIAAIYRNGPSLYSSTERGKEDFIKQFDWSVDCWRKANKKKEELTP